MLKCTAFESFFTLAVIVLPQPTLQYEDFVLLQLLKEFIIDYYCVFGIADTHFSQQIKQCYILYDVENWLTGERLVASAVLF